MSAGEMSRAEAVVLVQWIMDADYASDGEVDDWLDRLDKALAGRGCWLMRWSGGAPARPADTAAVQRRSRYLRNARGYFLDEFELAPLQSCQLREGPPPSEVHGSACADGQEHRARGGADASHGQRRRWQVT